MNISTLLATKGTQVVTIRPRASVRDALAELSRHNIGALVVVDEGGLPVGILSERDVVRTAARREDLFTLTVESIMSRDVVAATPGDDLKAVGHTMTEKRIRHLPVVDQGKLLGIVSIGDVVKAQRDQYEGEVDTLQMQLLRD